MANTLDGSDLEAVFGLKVLVRPDSFLQLPTLKATVEHDWPEEMGIDKDLTDPKYEGREFTLGCGLKGSNIADFKNKINGLFTQLRIEGIHTLYLEWLDLDFSIYYKSMANFKIVSKLTAGIVYAKFDLILGEMNPDSNIEPVYLVDDDGAFIIA